MLPFMQPAVHRASECFQPGVLLLNSCAANCATTQSKMSAISRYEIFARAVGRKPRIQLWARAGLFAQPFLPLRARAEAGAHFTLLQVTRGYFQPLVQGDRVLFSGILYLIILG
jgi:hypothetical protein